MTIPRAVYRACAAICVLAPVFVACVASQFPGITLDGRAYWDGEEKVALSAMQPGFAAAFGITEHEANWFTVFPGLLCSFCFLWASAKQIHALAYAGLLFPTLLKQTAESDTPVRAILATILFGLAVAAVAIVVVQTHVWSEEMVERAITCVIVITMCLVYVSALAGYVCFRFWGQEEPPAAFRNPLGTAGAACGALVFALVLAAMPWARHASLAPGPEAAVVAASFACVAAYLAAMSAYYFVVARGTQTITPAEIGAWFGVYNRLGWQLLEENMPYLNNNN